MELKVWVEGIQRIVCGVTVNTTCQDVVFALAHATGKVGRFTLIERWRNNERLLAPNENPLKLLLKWGEYANDVQFILQRSENRTKQQQQPVQQQKSQQQQQQQQTHLPRNGNNNHNNNSSDRSRNLQTNAVMKRPLGLSNNNNNNNNNNNYNKNSNNNNSSSSSSSLSSNNNNNIENALNATTKQKANKQSDEINLNISQASKTKELKKSFGAFDVKQQNENVGIVKGVPQRFHLQHQEQSSPTSNESFSSTSTSTTSNNTNISTQNQRQYSPTTPAATTTQTHFLPKHEKSLSNPIEMSSMRKSNDITSLQKSESNNKNNNSNNIYNQLGAHNSKSINEINLAEVRSSLERRTKTGAESPELLFPSHSSSNSSEHLLDIFNGNAKYQSNVTTELYKNAPTISANGALVPPPYRDPPPPRNSPMQLQAQRLHAHESSSSPLASQSSSSAYHNNPFLSDYQNDYELELHNLNNNLSTTSTTSPDDNENIFQGYQYNELLELIQMQRQKLNAQQMELDKCDAEISFLETKEREHQQELESISREITKADLSFKQGSEQLQTLQYVEEEHELVKKQEVALKSELALLRSKLANCETELLQCTNKIRLLMDDIEIEQRSMANKQKSKNAERDILNEMECLQSELEQAKHKTNASNKTSEDLKKEISHIEKAITEKKRQVEQLVNEMKEVNLQSLTITTSEEIKHLLEGPTKPGSSRRIIGSPRQLENAVPTSKNPHGVWV